MTTKRAKNEITSVSRDTKQYAEGVQAFSENVSIHDCPYPIGHGHRVGWLTGWMDEDVRRRLGPVFDKYEITYP